MKSSNNHPILRSNWETVVFLEEAYRDNPDVEWRLSLSPGHRGTDQAIRYQTLTREQVESDEAWDKLKRFPPAVVRLYYAIYRQGVRNVPVLDNMPLASFDEDGDFLPLIRLISLISNFMDHLFDVIQGTRHLLQQVAGPGNVLNRYPSACLDSRADLYLLGERIAELGQVYCGLAVTPPIPEPVNRVAQALRSLEGHIAIVTPPAPEVSPNPPSAYEPEPTVSPDPPFVPEPPATAP